MCFFVEFLWASYLPRGFRLRSCATLAMAKWMEAECWKRWVDWVTAVSSGEDMRWRQAVSRTTPTGFPD